MNAVVTRRVIPSAAQINEAAAIRQPQMCVGTVEITACPLTLEVINDTRQCLALENIVVNLEFAGADLPSAGLNRKNIVSRIRPRGKIRCPEPSRAPSVHLTR